MPRSPRGYLFQQFIPGSVSPSGMARPIAQAPAITPAEEQGNIGPEGMSMTGEAANMGLLGGTAGLLAGTGTGQKVAGKVDDYYQSGGIGGVAVDQFKKIKSMGVGKFGKSVGSKAKNTVKKIGKKIKGLF